MIARQSLGIGDATPIVQSGQTCPSFQAADAEGNCTLKQWCAEASALNPFSYVLCLPFDVSNVAQSGVATQAAPTVVPGTGTPALPSNYNAATGTCSDAIGNPATCSTTTPATKIQFNYADPAVTPTCDAWYCTMFGVGCDTCDLLSNWPIWVAVGIGALIILQPMLTGGKRR